MGLFDIKPYKPGKNSKRKSTKLKPFKPFEPVKLKPFKLFEPVKLKPFSFNVKSSKTKTKYKPLTGLFQPVKMTPIKVNPINSKTKNLVFGFDLAKPARKIKGKKSLSYKQAKMRFPGLSPHGDADKDGVQNWLDCRPFDPMRQGSWKEETKHTKGGKARKREEFLDLHAMQDPLVNRLSNILEKEAKKAWEQRRQQALEEQEIAKETKARNAAKLQKTDENPLTPAPYPKSYPVRNEGLKKGERYLSQEEWKERKERDDEDEKRLEIHEKIKKLRPDSYLDPGEDSEDLRKQLKEIQEEEAEEYDQTNVLYQANVLNNLPLLKKGEGYPRDDENDSLSAYEEKEEDDDEAYEKLSSKDKAKANEGLLDY